MEPGSYLRTRDQARAYSFASRWAEALPLWQQLTEENPVDGRNWQGLAEASFAVGRYRGALVAYRQVGRLGVHDDEHLAVLPGAPEYLIARCHAALGDHDAALSALADAMRNGFTRIDEAVQDSHLEPLRVDPRFRAVLDITDADGLPRNAGWRTDLGKIVREARRRRPVPLPAPRATEFDAAADQLHTAIPGLSDAEVMVGMMRLLALLDDGHAFLEVPSGHDTLSRALPVQFYDFAEGLYVTSAEPAYASLLGERVLALGDSPVLEVLRAVEPLICRDNEYRPGEIAPTYLRRTPVLHALGVIDSPDSARLTTPAGEFDVVARRGNIPRSRHFPNSPTMRQYHDPRSAPLYLRHTDRNFWFERLPEHQSIYCQINSVGDSESESIESFSNRLGRSIDDGECRHLVIDIRWNSGGNVFLLPALLDSVLRCRGLHHSSGYFLIVGRRTFSASANLAKYLEWFVRPHLTIIGEPPSTSLECVGETVPFELPYSNLLCNISNLYWQGMTPLDRRSWIAPDILVSPTFAAYRQGCDLSMAAAMATLRAHG